MRRIIATAALAAIAALSAGLTFTTNTGVSLADGSATPNTGIGCCHG